jgi:hypothetical protein
MLEPLLGSSAREHVLVYLACRQEGYGREIARFFQAGLGPVQKQLARLEQAGVINGRQIGRTRLYALNPRYPFQIELVALLERSLLFYPAAKRKRLMLSRRRPLRAGKPL